MSRLTVRDVRQSKIPGAVGVNSADTPKLCSFLNEALERLVKCGGEAGWWGTWARMAFTLTPGDVYITTPREVARVISFDVCRRPIRIQNQFYEFMEFGYGLNRKFITASGCNNNNCCQYEESYDRGTFPTAVDITSGMKLRAYITNAADVKKRIFYTGKDTNGVQITGVDNGIPVRGAFITLDGPFADSAYALSTLDALSKEDTLGPVQLYGVTAAGVETLLATLSQNEKNPSYRRYFLNGLPTQCCDCDSPANVTQIEAIVKLEHVPVSSDTDYLLIGNIPALKNECLAVRYGEVDTQAARAMGRENHAQAVRILNEEIVHYTGKLDPAVIFAPFGKATLERAGLGMI